VGMLLPADADGNAIRAMLMPALQKAGFTVVDAGPYQNGIADFSAQIALFKREGVEIFNTFPFPPDFAVFWRQAAQRGLAQQVKICQMAKAGLFAPELEALGPLGDGLHAGAYWHRAYPFSSPATGMTSRQLADGYEKVRGKQWNQQVGATASLFDAALAALKACPNPKDKAALAKALSTLKADTAVGAIDFTAGAQLHADRPGGRAVGQGQERPARVRSGNRRQCRPPESRADRRDDALSDQGVR
jgi:branched-chain amino acid transport system substrate-binding protein